VAGYRGRKKVPTRRRHSTERITPSKSMMGENKGFRRASKEIDAGLRKTELRRKLGQDLDLRWKGGADGSKKR